MKLKRKQVQKPRISPRMRMAMFSTGIFAVAVAAFLIYGNLGNSENAAAGTGVLESKSVTTQHTILNECEPLTADASSGATQIRVLNNSVNFYGRFNGSLEAGSLILIVQMQSNEVPSTGLMEAYISSETELFNAGKYEFAEVSGIEKGSRINLTAPLKNSYTVSGKTQVVRVPRYSALTVNPGASVTSDPWDGTTGGIVAIEVNGNTVINGSINVSGKGFKGGITQRVLRNSSGPGSLPIPTCANDTACNRILAGDGGSKEINGGGIVYLITGGPLSGAGNIQANGDHAPGIANTKTGMLSGGSGGSVFIFSRNAPVNEVTISANGGNGSMLDTGSAQVMKGGRGGTGGIIRTNVPGSIKCSVAGGLNGSSKELASSGTGVEPAGHAHDGIISTGIILPFSADNVSGTRLKFFTANLSGQVVKINWVTTSEVNNDYFSIQRSPDGQNFTTIYKMNGKGNTDSETEYRYEDDAPVQGAASYRLTQTDLNGHTVTFPPVKIRTAVQANGSQVMTVTPNPFGDHFTVACFIEKAGLVDFRLMDLSGSMVRNETAIARIGNNSIPLKNLDEIPKGVYFLSMTPAGGKTSTIKIMK